MHMGGVAVNGNRDLKENRMANVGIEKNHTGK